MFSKALGLTFSLQETLTEKRVNGYHEEAIRKIQKVRHSLIDLFKNSVSQCPLKKKDDGGYFRLKDTKET